MAQYGSFSKHKPTSGAMPVEQAQSCYQEDVEAVHDPLCKATSGDAAFTKQNTKTTSFTQDSTEAIATTYVVSPARASNKRARLNMALWVLSVLMIVADLAGLIFVVGVYLQFGMDVAGPGSYSSAEMNWSLFLTVCIPAFFYVILAMASNAFMVLFAARKEWALVFAVAFRGVIAVIVVVTDGIVNVYVPFAILYLFIAVSTVVVALLLNRARIKEEAGEEEVVE